MTADRDGYRETAIAWNLGHATTAQVREVYGIHTPDMDEFLPQRGAGQGEQGERTREAR